MTPEERENYDDPYNAGNLGPVRRRAPLPEKRLVPRWIPGLFLSVAVWWALAVVFGWLR